MEKENWGKDKQKSEVFGYGRRYLQRNAPIRKEKTPSEETKTKIKIAVIVEKFLKRKQKRQAREAEDMPRDLRINLKNLKKYFLQSLNLSLCPKKKLIRISLLVFSKIIHKNRLFLDKLQCGFPS